MALTELQCRQAKPREKIYTISDGNGLILEIRPSGKKYWISRIWENGKERRRSLGSFPDTSAREARLRNIELRTSFTPSSEDSFNTVIDEWLENRVDGRLAPGYARVIRLRLNKFIRPSLGNLSISDISSAKILSVCRSIEETGIIETAHRVRQIIGQVFRYAIATGRAENDLTSALTGALKQAPVRHHATITDKEGIRALIQGMKAYSGIVVRHALFFSIYTFCRPGEVRSAEWSEIDWDKSEWRIPGEKMKMKRPHIVPLCSQCIETIESLKQFTGHQKWLFPSARNDGRCMSENTVRIALRTMGFENEDITPHGFRGMASTILNENGWPSDVIERQLAHIERNAVRAAYNHAEYLDQRREMMQWWGDWLEELS
ncbi:tyrosine-type recombinase/integrase [Aminobacterium colombiense]|uniref:Integrase family protein n=1 Tax=Aminobacterium colombiense (strain DSM 12261 / ALA-1) TaxID=572547 RepID=D5EFE2_AMICL|nr:tyrosine-type recombinase/integrase [Aminobacterium colombiense]ADE57274.1 integrase family protein [Aminobacterium colombiense DSM 12261]